MEYLPRLCLKDSLPFSFYPETNPPARFMPNKGKVICLLTCKTTSVRLADLTNEIIEAGYAAACMRFTGSQSWDEGRIATEAIVSRIGEAESAIAIKQIKNAGL
jgi:hypothetical protein